MIGATKDMLLPTAIVGSIPRPAWYTDSLHGRSFKQALSDRNFREQYIDAVGAYILDQTSAGLDIVTDGDAAASTMTWAVAAGSSIRWNGSEASAAKNDIVERWTSFVQPGRILWELMEAYQQPTLVDTVTAGPWQYTEIWKTTQRLTDKPVKFGAISVDSLSHMIRNEAYDTYRDLLLDLADIANREYRQLADAGCPIIQIEEPLHHITANDADTDLDLLTEAFNRQVDGVNTEIWAHTCWGNPAQQTTVGNSSYEPALEASVRG